MDKQSNFSLILTYVASHEQAQQLAEQLLTASLIVCANIGAAVESHYLWKNEYCKEKEIPLWLKTLPVMNERVKEYLNMQHPYETPVILIYPVQVNEAYQMWAESSLAINIE